MFQLSDQARQVLENAKTIASKTNSSIGTDYILLALLMPQDEASEALHSEGVSARRLEAMINKLRTEDSEKTLESTISVQVEKVLSQAERMAKKDRTWTIETKHLLLSLIDSKGLASRVLEALEVDFRKLRARLGASELVAGYRNTEEKNKAYAFVKAVMSDVLGFSSEGLVGKTEDEIIDLFGEPEQVLGDSISYTILNYANARQEILQLRLDFSQGIVDGFVLSKGPSK